MSGREVTSQRGRFRRRIISMALALYPRAFKETLGADFALALEDWMADRSAGRFKPLRLLWVLFKTGALEWLRPSAEAAEASRGDATVRQLAIDDRGRKAKVMELTLQDLRFALRSLSRRPGFVIIAVATLAVGVGANTAIFTVVDTVLLQPLPYEVAEDLLILRRVEERAPGELRSMSQPDIEDLSELDSIAALVAFDTRGFTLTGSGEPEVVSAGFLNEGLLEVFALQPAAGRDLTRADNLPNGPRVIVVSHAFWMSRLGGREDAVGSTLELDGEAHEIVGIAPEGFSFPEDVRLWAPLYNDVEGCGRSCHLLTGIGRLSDGHTLEEAQLELGVAAQRLARDYPADNRGKSFVAKGLRDHLVGDARRGLLILLGAVGLVMLIAAANMASLQVARGTARKREMTVRTFLGASRGRLCRLVLIEAGLLGIVGGVLGIGLAILITDWIMSVAPDGVPQVTDLVPGLRVFGYGLVLSLGAALLFSSLPAWRLASATALAGPRTSEDRGDVRSRTFLLVGEVALSLTLLVGAILLMSTYSKILEVDLGFEKDTVLSFFVALPDNGYSEPEKVVTFFERLEQELAAVPGVESVGGILGRPFAGNTIGTSWHYLDRPRPEEGDEPSARVRIILPGYLETLRIPTVRGRALADSDRHGGAPVAVVNEAFVRRFAELGDPLQREVQLGVDFGFAELPRTIVGVIGDTQTESLTGDPRPEIFVPQAQMAVVWMSVVVRARGTNLWPQLTDAVQRVDPLIPLRSRETLSEAVDRARGPARFYFMLLAGFAGIAVLLSAIGLYGVVSYIVARRTREMAIRLAVGASRWTLVRLVFAQGLLPVASGIAIGLAAALAGSRLLGSLLYEVKPFDPAVYLLATVVLAVVSMLAMVAPAVRAASLAPTRALEEE